MLAQCNGMADFKITCHKITIRQITGQFPAKVVSQTCNVILKLLETRYKTRIVRRKSSVKMLVVKVEYNLRMQNVNAKCNVKVIVKVMMMKLNLI